MQTREVIKEIRWIRSLVSTELENWMFHKGMKEEPDVIRCIVACLSGYHPHPLEPGSCSVGLAWTAGKGRRRRIEEAIRLILDCSENRTGV